MEPNLLTLVSATVAVLVLGAAALMAYTHVAPKLPKAERARVLLSMLLLVFAVVACWLTGSAWPLVPSLLPPLAALLSRPAAADPGG